MACWPCCATVASSRATSRNLGCASLFGAAWATFFAYAGMALALYIVSHKFYPVDYEFGRLLKIGIALGIVVVAHAFRHQLFPGVG